MEIITIVENPVELKKLLKKHRYDVYALDDNLVFESKHTKPSTWFFYIMLFIGVLRIINQRVIQGMISIGLGIAGLILMHFEKRKFDMTSPDIKKVAVATDGVALTFRDAHRDRIQLSREEVKSLALDISYDGNKTLGYVSIRDSTDTVYTPFILMNKSESLVKHTGEEIMRSIKNKLSID